jgi:4-hydroxy-tetrahydrodipicolinate reductase
VSATPLRLVVHGAAGRMGQRVIACAAADTPPWTLGAAIERAGHPRSGVDAGTLAGLGAAGVAVSDAWNVPADVVIDFSLPEAVEGIVAACVARTLPLVVATTGLEDRERLAIANAARTIPVLQSPSMSLAVNISMDLVGRAAALLARVGGRTDVEIIECHHRHKEDSPSGTAAPVGPAPVPPTRSATTPSARGTIPASTRSCSAWTGSRSPSTSGPRAATAMPGGRWRPPGSSSAGRRACIRCATCSA